MAKTRALAKYSLNLGLLSVNVDLYTLVSDAGEVSFTRLHAACGTKLKQKMVCEECEEEANKENTIKGFEYEKGQYALVSDAEITDLAPKKDGIIKIFKTVQRDSISLENYSKSYYMLPGKTGNDGFETIRLALLESGLAAIGTCVIGQTLRQVALIADDQGILVCVLYFAHELKKRSGYTPTWVSDKSVKLIAETLQGMCEEPYKAPVSEYQENLRSLISAKISPSAPLSVAM